MRKLFFLMFFVGLLAFSLKADENPVDEQEFLKQLNNIKNPFEDGIPKPVVIAPPVEVEKPKPVIKPKPKPKPKSVIPVADDSITLPPLNLQGIVVGDGVHEAIINARIVSLHAYISGAQLIGVEKEGVELLYKGKKFRLKIDK